MITVTDIDYRDPRWTEYSSAIVSIDWTNEDMGVDADEYEAERVRRIECCGTPID